MTNTQIYIENILNLIKSMLHNEFTSLEDKNNLYTNSKYDEIEKILIKQKTGLENAIRHFSSFENHIEIIGKHLFNDLNEEQKNRFNQLLNREDLLIKFLLTYSNKFLKLLIKQEIELKKQNSKLNNNIIIKKIKEKTKINFIGLLKKEEIIFNEFLELFFYKGNSLLSQFNLIKKEELLNKIENYVLNSSIIITAVPLGPLEVLSLPFWTTYFSIKGLRHFQNKDDFEEWKRIIKNRIVK